MHISPLHLDSVLDAERKSIFTQKLPYFNSNYYLAGGTALALQLNHRLSYDFDLFGQHEITEKIQKQVISTFGKSIRITLNTKSQLTWFDSSGVKITLTQRVSGESPIHDFIDSEFINLQSAKDIASDKAYVIGRRGEWRDYVDLFACLQSGLQLDEIIKDANKRYRPMFDEKLFLEQLSYFEDLNYQDIEYVGDLVEPDTIKLFLTNTVRNYINSKL